MSDRTTILITGGASGIGLATARRLSGSMRVVVADLDTDAAQRAAAALNASGAEALGFGVNVSDRSQVLEMLDAVHRKAGPIHALFNNAGVALSKSTEEITEAEWDLVLDTHLKGAFLCTQAVLPDMIASGAGAIVNMCSIYSCAPMANGSSYAAAKSALYSLTRSLAAEFVSDGIRINAVAPGAIETPLLRGDRPDAEWESWKRQRGEITPLGRIGAPDEVASVVEFLVGPRSSYITGQLLHINGGQLMP